MFTVGFELEFAYPSKRGCPECWGEGEVECPSCDGRGEIDCPYCDGMGCEDCADTGYVECPDCDGDGRVECPECEGSGYESNASNEALEKMIELGADLTYDCSVYHREVGDAGRELRSPVFEYHDERTSWEYFIENITSLIEEGGGESSPDLRCGLHVHVQPYEGWTDELKEKMYSAWFNWAEKMFIEKFSPAYDRMSEFCQSWQDWAEDELDEDEYCWAQEGKVTPYYDRYMTLNVRSLASHGTLEFRLFNGTLDPGEIKEALTWVGSLTEAVLLYNDQNTIKEYFRRQIGLQSQAA